MGAWVGCPCRCRGKRRHNLKYVRPSPPHHTTPHHIPSHHTTLSCVPSTPRCGRRREGDLARCGRGCGCARVAVLSRGVGVGVGMHVVCGVVTDGARAHARTCVLSQRESTRAWCVCVSPTRASFLCVPLHPHHTAPHTTPHHTTSHHTTPPCPAFLPAPGAADGVNGTWRCGQCVCVCVGVGVGARVVLW